MVTKRISMNLSSSEKGLLTFSNNEEIKQYMEKHSDRIMCSYQHGVYDITDFLSDHPGGKEIVLQYKQKDISTIFKDESIHPHSQNAKRILAQYKIGKIVGDNKQSMKDQFENENEQIEERAYPLRVGKILNFDDFEIDLSKGYFYQIWRLSYKQYMEVVDNPVTIPFYVPLFDNKYLDMCSTTSWYTILSLWIPIAITHFYLGLTYSYESIPSPLNQLVLYNNDSFSFSAVLLIVLLSILTWTIAEYSLHRFLFHMEKWMPDHPLYRYLSFIIHGVHHALPMDEKRLVFPPSLGLIVYFILTSIVYTILPGNAGRIFVAGFIMSYLYYDMMHYYLHHNNPQFQYLKNLKSAHNKHHYLDDSKGFGISNKFWDGVFGTKFN